MTVTKPNAQTRGPIFPPPWIHKGLQQAQAILNRKPSQLVPVVHAIGCPSCETGIEAKPNRSPLLSGLSKPNRTPIQELKVDPDQPFIVVIKEHSHGPEDTRCETIALCPEQQNIVMPDLQQGLSLEKMRTMELEAIRKHYHDLGHTNVEVYKNYIHKTRDQDPKDLHSIEPVHPDDVQKLRQQIQEATDPLKSQQNHLRLIRSDQANQRLKSTPAQRKKIEVAVLDNGQDLNHPDGPKNLIIGPDTSSNDNDPSPKLGDIHGTHVSGIIAAHANNGIGVDSITPDAGVYVIRWHGGKRHWSTQVIVESLYAAANRGVRVINISYNTDSWLRDPAIMKTLNDLTQNRDILIFGSSGNNGEELPRRGSIDDIIFVNALAGGLPGSNSMKKADYSNYGINTDISAPGSQVLATVNMGFKPEDNPERLLEIYDQAAKQLKPDLMPTRELFEEFAKNSTALKGMQLALDMATQFPVFADLLQKSLSNGYLRLSGTSMAAPVAAGTAHKVWSENPSLTGNQVWTIMKASATNINGANMEYYTKLGAGMVNAEGAVAMAQKTNTVPKTIALALFDQEYAYIAPSLTFDPNTINQPKGQGPFEIVDASGRVVKLANSDTPYKVGTNWLTIDIARLRLKPGNYTLRLSSKIRDAFGRRIEGLKKFKFQVIRTNTAGPEANDGATNVMPGHGF